MTTLIITEKPKVAERIAKAIGTPKKHSNAGVPYYEVGDAYVAPAVGHVYGLREKNGGGWSYPVFDIEWVPNYKVSKSADYTKKYLDNIRDLARECSDFVISCDYDIEGEVIGYNVVRYACGVDPFSDRVRRMKYSTLTQESLAKAYRSLSEVDRGMAEAGLARHTLDWYWGINLSRALSLSARLANRYATLSIGRVQGPTLKILATRERNIKAFKTKKYWVLELVCLKDREQFSAFHVNDKFWEEKEAIEVKDRCGDKAVVTSVDKKKSKQMPPHPFDLTTLQTEAYRCHNIDPRRTLEIAQELYISAYISYPRTSSQQLPKELKFTNIMQGLSNMKDYKPLCSQLLSKSRLTPNNGKKVDPAHPAIHPTGEVPESLNTEQKKIYDLVVRRFLATFGDPAVRESVKVELDNNKEKFIAEGITTVEKGWHIFYGEYAKFKENELPQLSKGDVVDVKDLFMHEKETQPPKRFTPASIIREMEKNNIGTKATRSQIVDILFKRGYVTGKTIEVTTLGLNVVDTLEKYCPEVLDVELTRQFEEEMEQIQDNKLAPEKVVKGGRETLERICTSFKENEAEIGKSLALAMTKTMRDKRSLGSCLKCETGELVLRTSKYGGNFIGCTNYPKCTYTISIPKGKLKKGKKCPHCSYSMLVLQARKPWSFCINPECPSKKNSK